MRRLPASLISLGLASGALIAAQTAAPQMPPGVTRTPLADNPTVMVAKLRFEPGARETPHTHPFSALVIYVTPATVEMKLGDKTTTGRLDAGHVDFIAREMPHAAANVGSAALEVVTIAVKPDRTRPGAAPPSPVTAGIVRTPVLENDEVRVARVKFAPGAREVDHQHPFDLVFVALSGGRTEVLVGAAREIENRPPGFTWFLPRDVTHMAANAGAAPSEFISVGIK